MCNSVYKNLIDIVRSYSFLALVVYMVTVCVYRDSNRVYYHSEGVVTYDMAGYWGYLQAFYLNKDYSFSFLDRDPRQCHKVKVAHKNGDKVVINKYSVGVALLLTPFFGLGHLEAYYWGVPKDGFSYTYLYWGLNGAIFYVFCALLMLHSLLIQHYSDKITAVVLLAIGLGTNLLHYTVFEFLMTHAYSFFLFTAAIFLMDRWLKKPTYRTFILMSLVSGLIAVMRLPNMIFFLVVAFWRVGTKEGVAERIKLFGQYWNMLAIGVVCFILPFVPQVAYWYHITGRYFVNAYAENHEFLYWGAPMIAEILIGYRKGWLIYTPIITLGFWGMRYLKKEHSDYFWPILIFTALNIYVVSCWSSWWYGGSFGMRALIEGSVVMAFPLAAFLQKMGEAEVKSHLAAIVVFFLVGLNMFQCYQYRYGVIHYMSMTRKAYWGVFGVLPPAHKHFMERRDKYLIHPTREEARREVYHQTIW